MASTSSKKTNDNQISHYRLGELLVQQTVSSIYLAQDTRNNKSVFLVTLQPDAAKSGDLTERFQRRAETLAQLEAETLLPLQDHGVDGKRPFAIMPYRAGQFLSEKLETQPPPEEQNKPDIVERLKLVQQLAAGLSVTHPAGLIHHDLRPENIYLDETGQPYLLDMVVPPVPPAAFSADENQPKEVDYQSPEQKAGKALSGRSNIFSLGVILYHLLAGHKPALPVSEWDIFEYKGSAREIPLKSVRADLTEATYTAVQNSIWQKEWSRYETVNAQIAALDAAIAAESAPPPPPPPAWRKLFNLVRQRRTRRIAIPVIGLLLLLLLIFMFMRGRGNRQQNVTPSPAAIMLPADTEAEAEPEPDAEEASSATNTPTLTAEADNTPALNEDEVLPPTQEVAPTSTVTPEPTATETAVSPTTPTVSIASITPSPTASNTPPPATATTSAPDPTASSCAPSPPFGWVLYTIQANDSLSSLSQATNTTVERVQEVNCLNSIVLSIGQQIWLPFSPNPTETPDLVPTAVPPGTTPQPPEPTSGPPTPTPPSVPNP